MARGTKDVSWRPEASHGDTAGWARGCECSGPGDLGKGQNPPPERAHQRAPVSVSISLLPVT